MVLIFLVMPVVVYVSPGLLPRGRDAAGGIALALVALAAVVQLLRRVFGPWQARRPYPLLAGLALFAAGSPTPGPLGM